MKNGISQLCNAFLLSLDPSEILLADLKSRGLSILFITHALSLGCYISERAVILYRGCVAEMGATEKIFDNPRHPYTKMLMASIPRLDRKWETAEVEPKANHLELAGGCVYCERCPVAFGKCREAPLLEIGKDHLVACWKEFEKNPEARQNTNL